MSEPNTSSTDAARPQVGSWLHDFVARCVYFPVYCGTTSFDAVTEEFRREAARVEQLCGQFSPDDFVRRAMVPHLLGIDEIERTWSAAMVVEHVLATGEAIGKTLVFLTHNQPSPLRFDGDACRPRGGRGVAVMADFRAFAAAYPRMVTRELGERSSPRTHPHPWLGELGVHDWHCLATLHLRAHRRQLAEIRRQLSGEARAGRLPAGLLDPTPEANPQP